MVWIYGGGFQMGGSDSETYGPHYFMDREVVFVSFNYRLGTFGFLSFEDPNLSGNFGLKDQQLALQWVKENIEAFGGDPDSITIFGESAGAASVHYHLVSPKSQGLFHRAIMQSGSTFCPWAMIPSGIAKQRAEAFATLLGCHGTVEEVGDCLRQIPSDAILKTQLKFVEWGIDPMISFAPVIEPEHPEAFITQHPYLYKTSADIPLVIGFNSDEGAIRTSKLCADNMLEFNQLNEQWERYLPIALVLNDKVDKQDLPRVKSELKNFYLGGNKAQVDNIRNMSDNITLVQSTSICTLILPKYPGHLFLGTVQSHLVSPMQMN
uniref:Carboxylic ester hydrolase n=1 Tax=Cacopsylla melanoneura TaxID=428564 RepID=A0A8D9EP51_9HEMI